MLTKENDKETQINQILNIVKIASLSFPAIALLQYNSFRYNDIVLFLKSGVMIAFVLLLILTTYILWVLIQSKINDKNPIKKWIDPLISMTIAFLSVMLTGSYESSYKYLFLFVIISSSIECTMKESILVSGMSAIFILGIDLGFAPKAEINTFFESDIVLACVFLIVSWTIGYYVNLRKKHIENLKELVNIDGLTGLYNHRYFFDYLSRNIKESENDGSELSLLFIDIDNFKYYNDLYGHQKGDEVLSAIAGIIKKVAQCNSLISRYGGEEFTVLMPKTSEASAIEEAEKIRKSVQEYKFDGQENLPGENLTISVGVSVFPIKAKTGTELLEKADEACYRAKFLSKNRVEAYYSILEELKNNIYNIDSDTIASTKTLIAVINAKDKYTYGHVERVVYYCTLLARKMKLVDTDKKRLIFSAYLHDIGKINISEQILMKTEPLNEEEWEILKNHPQNAVEILKNIGSLNEMIPIVLHHHEKYNGTGYPDKLKGEEIDYLARMLTVADSFDAMTSMRPYQAKKTFDQAISELIRCSGTQFDPEIVKAFISAIQERQ
ncbi:MAG: diguanylate cyclase [Oscillospiraceae bacterium]|nr:diguanylate cyclase [Oscillospiraceae bacterium]